MRSKSGIPPPSHFITIDLITVRRLAPISFRGVLSILLDPLQPTWLISRAARLLVFLATCQLWSSLPLPCLIVSTDPSLFRYLSSPTDQDSDAELACTDTSKLPHIERLCFHLTDNERQSQEVGTREFAVTIFFVHDK
jgi:hypothetical protein